MLIVCDSADIKTELAQIPNVIVVGGYLIERARLPALLEEVRNIKTAHVENANAPVKWNLRDVRRALGIHGLPEDVQERLLAVSDQLRSELLDALGRSGAKLFVSVFRSHARQRDSLQALRADCVTYSFGNFLQRTARYKKRAHPDDRVELLLDWPAGNSRSEFVSTYLAGWRDGTCGGSIYESGPLEENLYEAAPIFGVTELDPRLQLADLVVGAARSFVNSCLEGAPQDNFGVRQFGLLRPHLGANPNSGNIRGWGVTVAPASSEFSDQIFEGLRRLA